MSLLEKRIAAFKFIRDIPYKIAPDVESQDYCCSTKAEFLADLMNNLGLKTRFIICRFEWETTPIHPSIIALNADEDTTHMYMEVFIPETQQWVICDPTWDIGLQESGFDIAQWDGLTSTQIAVAPSHIFSPEESAELIKGYAAPGKLEEYLKLNCLFIAAVNSWLHEQRVF